ncbi:MAG: hypothetical protein R3A80_07995 [Bdellovibrionota bacterium]
MIKNIVLLVMICVSQLQASDLTKAWKKVEKAAQKTTEKVESWGDHMKDRNKEELEELDATLKKLEEKAKKLWADVEDTAQKAWSDVEAESQKVTRDLEDSWKNYKEKRKQEKAADKVPALSEADKIVAGNRVYKKLDLKAYPFVADQYAYEVLAKSYESALQQESLNVEDGAYVKSSETGETVLHSLVQKAYVLEQERFLAKQIAQLKDVDLKLGALSDSVEYEQTLLAITYFAETTSMASVQDAKGQFPIDIVLTNAPLSINIARHLVSHDTSGFSQARLNELFSK